VSNTILATIRRHFLSGVLVVVPLILTFIVIRFLFTSIDGVLQPYLHSVLGYYIPGLGLVTTLCLIILAGLVTRNYVGHRIYRVGDRILTRMPIVRPIYSAAKQLLTAITGPSTKSFQEVVLIEYPRKGVYAMGFASNTVELEPKDSMTLVTVFVPSTPTPVSGFVIMVPPEEVVRINMTIEEGVKFLVSGGVASPDTLAGRITQEIPSSPKPEEVD